MVENSFQEFQFLKCVDNTLVEDTLSIGELYQFRLYNEYTPLNKEKEHRIFLYDVGNPFHGWTSDRFVAATKEEIEEYFRLKLEHLEYCRVEALKFAK